MEPNKYKRYGIENMISGIEYIRNMKIPILGICLGMQLMIIEYFKNVIGIKDATSEEFDKDGTNVITKINTNDNNIGGTMRLGLKEINLDFSLKNIYNKDKTLERHRHRYAINDNFKNILYENNCLVSGLSEGIIEIIELKNHPWYIGCQYHPEYNSSPFNPHPLFLSFIENCI